MKQTETKFKEKVLKDLRRIPQSWWEKIQQRALRGTPDILGSLCGIFCAIELKTDDGDLDPLQAHKLEMITETGAIAVVARPSNWEDSFAQLCAIAEQNMNLEVSGPSKNKQH